MPKLLDILTYPHAFLKVVAKPIEKFDDALKELAADMAETMYAAPGVGLAATQVGVDQSLLVYDISDPNDPERQLCVLINPKITSMDGEIVSEGEGCLSFPDFRADIPRAQRVTVEALDLEGKPLYIEAEDFHAVVLQHEIDHLLGKVFFDKASPLKKNMYTKKLKKQAKMEKYDDR